MKVRIKEDINLKDLKENYWEGCRDWTMEFLSKYYGAAAYANKTFEVKARSGNLYEIYNTCIDCPRDYIFVNKKCFEEIPVKEMTVAEISEALGYEVKVVSKGGKVNE